MWADKYECMGLVLQARHGAAVFQLAFKGMLLAPACFYVIGVSCAIIIATDLFIVFAVINVVYGT